MLDKCNSYFLLLFLLLFIACKDTKWNTETQALSANHKDKLAQAKVHYIDDFPAMFSDSSINIVIEIPTGTIEKWEVVKNTGQLELQHIDNEPRLIEYLGYPGNYGMIPQTLLDKESGGDGDPLDVIVLSPPNERGAVVKGKLIGVLKLLDGAKQDDKLIAVQEHSPLFHVNSIEELKQTYPGILDIVEKWFLNYKGSGIIFSKGYESREKAFHILENAREQYQLQKKKK